MIFGVDEYSVVWAGRDAGLAADADVLVKIDYTVGPLKHRAGRASGYARSVRTLVAACNLVGAPCLRINSYVDVLYVCSRNGKRNQVFRLASSGACVTSDTPGLVDNLCPLLWSGLRATIEKFGH
jgi:hypothetical protein